MLPPPKSGVSGDEVKNTSGIGGGWGPKVLLVDTIPLPKAPLNLLSVDIPELQMMCHQGC